MVNQINQMGLMDILTKQDIKEKVSQPGRSGG